MSFSTHSHHTPSENAHIVHTVWKNITITISTTAQQPNQFKEKLVEYVALVAATVSAARRLYPPCILSTTSSRRVWGLWLPVRRIYLICLSGLRWSTFALCPGLGVIKVFVVWPQTHGRHHRKNWWPTNKPISLRAFAWQAESFRLFFVPWSRQMYTSIECMRYSRS